MRRTGLFVALLLVVAYLSMAIFSAACAIEHSDANHASHHPHHGSNGVHTSFCAWACQANQTVDLVASVPHGKPLSLIALRTSIESPAPSLLAQHAASSRAPPQR